MQYDVKGEIIHWDEKLFWLKIQRCPGLGVRSWFKFQSLNQFELQELNPISWRSLDLSMKTWTIFQSETLQAQCLKELEWGYLHHIHIIHWRSDFYPRSLKQSQWAHPVLSFYSEQNLSELDIQLKLKSINEKLCFGIVGSRKSSTEAKIKLNNLFDWVKTQSPICIVSGLAKGMDTIAHQFALDQGIETIALIGEGFAPYLLRKSHWHSKLIIASQFAPQMTASKSSFPLRNQVIAGISEGLLVVESQTRGGSLITAQMALDDGKALWAHPGNWNSHLSQGALNLISLGATAMWKSEQSLEYFQSFFPHFNWDLSISSMKQLEGSVTHHPILQDLDRVTQRVYFEIKNGIESIPELLGILKIDGKTLIAALSLLEVMDLIYSNIQNHWFVCN